jgi:hypothetical protein
MAEEFIFHRMVLTNVNSVFVIGGVSTSLENT